VSLVINLSHWRKDIIFKINLRSFIDLIFYLHFFLRLLWLHLYLGTFRRAWVVDLNRFSMLRLIKWAWTQIIKIFVI
jgi:hypothetical protein